jgi:DNA-binding NarL/FixJ family response regulator
VIRVLVVDDQRLMREGLFTLLNMESDIEVVHTAASGEDALAWLGDHSVDIVLMDLRMPGMDGIEATRRVLTMRPQVRVLMLTTYEERDDVVGALSAGAMGYLLKDMPAEEIAEAIRVAHAGGAILPPTVARTFLSAVRGQSQTSQCTDAGVGAARAENSRVDADSTVVNPAQAGLGEAERGHVTEGFSRNPIHPSHGPSQPLASLTEREMDVLHCLANGMSNREIATALFVTEGTVKNHVSSLISKLGLRDRTQVALYAVRHGYGRLDGGENSQV